MQTAVAPGRNRASLSSGTDHLVGNPKDCVSFAGASHNRVNGYPPMRRRGGLRTTPAAACISRMMFRKTVSHLHLARGGLFPDRALRVHHRVVA